MFVYIYIYKQIVPLNGRWWSRMPFGLAQQQISGILSSSN